MFGSNQFLQQAFELNQNSVISGPTLPTDLKSFLKSTNLHLKTYNEIKPIRVICCHENCDDPVSFVCKCSIDGVFVCNKHLTTHIIQEGQNDPSKTHTQQIFIPDNSSLNIDKLADHILSYISNLEKLKYKIVKKVSIHLENLDKDMNTLLGKIDEIIELNTAKIKDITWDGQKFYRNIDELSEYLNSDFKLDFIKSYQKVDIAYELMNIAENEITD